MERNKNVILCCFEDCSDQLIEVSGQRSLVLANHAICDNCRTVVLCESHFGELSQNGPFACPACGADQWHLVHRNVDAVKPSIRHETESRVQPIYAHAFPRGARIMEGGVVNTSEEMGGELTVVSSGNKTTYSGQLLAASESPSGDLFAISMLTSESSTLEIRKDAGRPWRLISEPPGQMTSLRFISDLKLLGVVSRQEGSWELFEFELETANRLNARRLYNLGSIADGASPPFIVATTTDEAIIVRMGENHPLLERLLIATGRCLESTVLPFWPDAVRSGPNAHLLLVDKSGCIALAKDTRVVTLFEKFDFVDGLFDDNGALWLASSNQGLRIDLQTGASEDLAWNRAIIGLTQTRASFG